MIAAENAVRRPTLVDHEPKMLEVLEHAALSLDFECQTANTAEAALETLARCPSPVANLRPYGKTGEIAANPKVELCNLDESHDQARITGVAKIVADRPTLESIWAENPLLRQNLGTLDAPLLIVYSIRPERVRYMNERAIDYHEVPIRE